MAGPWAAPGRSKDGGPETAVQGKRGVETDLYFQWPPTAGSGGRGRCSLSIILALGSVFPLSLTQDCRARQVEPVPRPPGTGPSHREGHWPQPDTESHRPQP